MSYLVLARKWRPRTFSQLIGQESVTRSLINALNQQRLHHAYLFTGTRGVGKTSVARLLAKALNCEKKISAEPCLSCDTCLAIEQGHFIDLIEVDGASKTRVEETRELLENTVYAPTSGRFKLYLIDEVHMLSQHSFNALLKTLEEPPAHVKFLFATTDPQKLPVTILSRCLQFNLKPISIALISQQLKLILEEEQIQYTTDAVELLAKTAKGSMRDALSLLDQVIPNSKEILSAPIVKSMLGYTQHDYALDLLSALIQLDAQQLIKISRQIATEGGYFHYILEELLQYFHQMTISQHLNGDNSLLSIPLEIQHLSKQLLPEDVQLFYQIGLKGLEDLALAPTLAIGFEMTLLRMLTFKPSSLVDQPKLAHEEITLINVHSTSATDSSIATSINANLADSHTSNNINVDIINRTTNPTPTLQSACPESSDNWEHIIKQLKLKGLALNAAENAELVNKLNHTITLRVTRNHESLFTSTTVKRLEDALTLYFNEPIKLTLQAENQTQASPAQKKQALEIQQQQEALLNIENDSSFQDLKEKFSAELNKNSIVSVKDGL